jgi:tetratricopeptide (TPR) repeat protein
LQAYDQVIRTSPQYAGIAYYNRAQTLKDLGRQKEAEQSLQKARELGFR